VPRSVAFGFFDFGSPAWIMNPLMMRWNPVPSKNPWRASFLKLATVCGASLAQNSIAICPFDVSITAISSAAAPALFSAAFAFGALAAALEAGGSAAIAAPATIKPAAVIPTTPRMDIRNIAPPRRVELVVIGYPSPLSSTNE
jgi:hypothetical protein